MSASDRRLLRHFHAQSIRQMAEAAEEAGAVMSFPPVPTKLPFVVYTPSGDQTGATDTAVIGSLLSALSSEYETGGLYVADYGVFYLDGPVTIPSGVGLISDLRSLGVPTGNYGDGGLPLTGSIFRLTSGFSTTTGVFLLSANAPASQQGGQILKGFTIDASALAASSTLVGIFARGWIGGVTLRELTLYSNGKVTAGNGISTAADGSGHGCDFWHGFDCKVSSWGTGFGLSGLSDSTWVACEATGNQLDNWDITNGGNSRYLGCKGEVSGSGYGFNLDGLSGFSGKWQFIGCSTETNHTAGWFVQGAGTGTAYLIGCVASDTTPFAYSGSTMNVKSDAAYNTSTSAPTLG